MERQSVKTPMRVFWAHILDRCYRPEALNLLILNLALATNWVAHWCFDAPHMQADFRHPLLFPINLYDRKPLRGSVARGAGLLFPDNRNATGYQHLPEGRPELSRLNTPISLPVFGCGNTLFFSPVFVKSICFNGFLRTGRL